MKIEQRVEAYVTQQHLLGQSDKVIVGISGGADSICLLFVLLELQKVFGFSMVAVHVHHGLRGAAADADEEYVRSVCREQNVEFYACHEDVCAYAKNHRLTVEEAGREVRRNAFEKIRRRCGGTKIALAHHQDDNAETLLWNLCRGTGLAGIGGMAPASGVWIRPLLCLKREEIESYLRERAISYCTDETNLEDDYTRNKIRNHVLPYLKEEINEQTASHMTETMRQMRELSGYIREETKRYEQACVTRGENEEILINKAAFENIPGALKPYVLHQAMVLAAGKSKDIESVHVRILEELLEKQVGKKRCMPYGIMAYRCYEGILLVSEVDKKEGADRAAAVMRSRIFSQKAETFSETLYTKRFDYDIIKNTVQMRHRRSGDYLTIDAEGRKQKLKQYFINEKIPQQERDGIWLIADGNHIMWIVGFRTNQSYRVTADTSTIIEITIDIDGGKENGRNS